MLHITNDNRTSVKVSADAGAAVIQSLQDIAPDLARFIIEFSYGDIISRAGIDGRVRELATVAILTALGNAQPQLKVHLSAALNVGVSRQELIEIIQQMALYARFPAALNGINVARDLFAHAVLISSDSSRTATPNP
ncbi:carboxymuconolactone decarboxylase family protein [Desulfopila aestuarii]|uniref:carboxymuconolactone decarboxylase family protein n=1 Tax=Desulfopila aestuarii TaxID=231440 RepID=UPI0009357C53